MIVYFLFHDKFLHLKDINSSYNALQRIYHGHNLLVVVVDAVMVEMMVEVMVKVEKRVGEEA